MPISFNDQAIILRRFPYGEADMLLVLYTRFHGKYKVSAKGSRRLLSRRGGHLDLFNHIKMQVREGKGIGYLNEVLALNSFENSKRELDRVRYYYYLAELIDAMVAEEDRGEVLFDRLVEIFNEWDAELPLIKEMEKNLRDFEVFLLKNLGHWSDEIQGRLYPVHPDARREYNQHLIENIVERPIKTFKTLNINT